MAKQKDPIEEVRRLTEILLILQLGLADVGKREIRSIAKYGLNRVTAVLRHLPKEGPKKGGGDRQ